MAVLFSPTNDLFLVANIPWNKSYQDVVNFSNASSQQSYISTHTFDVISEFSVVRLEKGIKVGYHIDDLYSVNYVAYKNKSKWIYCFVVDKQYINDGTTLLVLETDVYQTWLFDMSIKQCFVEREHVADDTIGVHITDEGIDSGEYIRNGSTVSGRLDDFTIMVAIGYDSSLSTATGQMYAGVYSGLSFLPYSTDSSGITALNTLIQDLATAGKSSLINSIFMMPTNFISTDPLYPTDYDINPTSMPVTFQGYTPKNNKLYCYPYCMLYVSNNQGSGAVYRYEFMDNPSNPEFKIVGELSPSPSVYLFPRNYKGLPTNVDEKLVLNNFPLCSWNNDVYANWLGQNRNKLMTSLATSVAMGVSGAMTENPMLMGMGITGVSTEISQVADRAIQPNQTVGNIGGSGALSVGIQDFFFYPTTITKEYAERIDSFFDMYGYKVNTVKQPNITGRPYWNYVKTINSIITGNIASNDIVELQNIFNKGVTIWHSPSNIGDYSLNNH